MIKPIEADVGTAAAVPEFNAEGGAKQYLFDESLKSLERQKLLEKLDDK